MFRAQMLTEMAGMSLEDGMVMQIHSGARRNINRSGFREMFGRDKGADVPSATNYLDGLQALLNKYGNERALEHHPVHPGRNGLLPGAGPACRPLSLPETGPALVVPRQSRKACLRIRQQTTETAGFNNTVGFNDDTRAFLSIPARHDVARRMDSPVPGHPGG